MRVLGEGNSLSNILKGSTNEEYGKLSMNDEDSHPLKGDYSLMEDGGTAAIGLSDKEKDFDSEAPLSPDDERKVKRMNFAVMICYISAHALGAAVWLSSTVFAIFILVFYIGAAIRHRWQLWDTFLPLYSDHTALSTTGMMWHLICAAILLLLGNIQILHVVRKKAPRVHHWCGRIYVACAFFAGFGGLLFIVTHGCHGGVVQNIGFGIYGLLMVLCSTLTILYAALWKNYDQHKMWATRTYTLSIGSWLYRMFYGVWSSTVGTSPASTSDFRGGFDYFMDFGFFIVPLLVTEAYLRAQRPQTVLHANILTVILLTSLLSVIIGTAYFMAKRWIPGMKAISNLKT